MEESKAYLVISSIPKPGKEELLHSYLSQAMPLAMKAGGVPVGRYVATKQLLGESGPTLIATVEFADEQAISNMMASPEFVVLGGLRGEVFERLDMIICKAM